MIKSNKSTISTLLVALLSQLGLSSASQAESAIDWGNWDINFNSYNSARQFSYSNYQPNSDQTRVAVNQGNLVEKTATNDFIGYALYGVDTEGSYIDNQLATLSLNPQNSGQLINPNNPNSTFTSGTLDISSDVEAFNLSFATTAEQTESNYFHFYSAKNPLAYSGGSNKNNVQKYVNGYGSGGLGAVNFYIYGNFVEIEANARIGKIMPASDIAYLAANYNNYTFYGYSNLDSKIAIAVNFQNATWSGTFGSNLSNEVNTFAMIAAPVGGPKFAIGHNGFSANGTISGATLTSTTITGNVTGNGVPAMNDVVGGDVKGTLVGIANADVGVENAGIVGKASLNVVSGVNTTRIVNDVFDLSSSSGFFD